MTVSDLSEILTTIKDRVATALQLYTGIEPEVSDINSRTEPRKPPYARVGIIEAGHTDFTVSSDSLVIGIQIIAIVSRNNREPQVVQFELAKSLLIEIFGESYEKTLIELSSGRIARLIPAARTTFLSDIEQMVAERMPDYTSVSITVSVEIPLGGKVI